MNEKLSERVKLVVCNEPQNCGTVKELKCQLTEAENKYSALEIADNFVIRRLQTQVKDAMQLNIKLALQKGGQVDEMRGLRTRLAEVETERDIRPTRKMYEACVNELFDYLKQIDALQFRLRAASELPERVKKSSSEFALERKES